MHDTEFDELRALAASPRSGERLRAMDRIALKSGGSVVRVAGDPRVVPLLVGALGDAELRVRRAAARGLRPWIADDPTLLDSVLGHYATDSFDGTFSHAGLYDTASGKVWVPRFQATRGHAALLADANTDRYFKFEFFTPGQAPQWIPQREGGAQLVLYYIPEWSYSRQTLVPAHDDRGRKRNRAEQDRCAAAVVGFYRVAALRCDVRVHRTSGGGGYHRERELDVDRIAKV